MQFYLDGRFQIQNPKSKIQNSLHSGALNLGISLTVRQIGQLVRYAEMLEEWNRVMNLTRVPSDEFVPLHFLDSLSVARAVDLTAPSRLIDVGTGAGFPGLVLKIAFPHLDVTLLDSTCKRLRFLDAVIEDLALTGARTAHGRAEEIGRDPAHRERYDFVTARAVSRLNLLAEYLIPLSRLGGTVVAMKSAGADEEIAEAEHAIQLLGGTTEQIRTLMLPESDIERKLVVIRKTGTTPREYPRDSSQIKARPL